MPRKRKYPKYDPAFCVLASEMGNKGATYEQIAEAIGVPLRYLRKWERQFPEMFSALTPAYKADLMRRVMSNLAAEQNARENKRAKKRGATDAR